MGEPTLVRPAAAGTGMALAPVASLGLVLAGCPACRLPLGVTGAPGLAAALAAYQRGCPKRHPVPTRPADDVCPGCGCEAELVLRASGWRCGDCLAEARLDDLAIPATAGRARGRRPVRAAPADPDQVIAHSPRRHRQHGHRRRPAERAVVA
jgi:hypothetical protein